MKKIFSKISTRVQDKLHSLFPELVAHPLSIGFSAVSLGNGRRRLSEPEFTQRVESLLPRITPLAHAAKSKDVFTHGAKLLVPGAAALPRAATALPSLPATAVAKSGPLSNLASVYASAVQANDALRGELADRGVTKPAAEARLTFQAGRKLPRGVSMAEAMKKLAALRLENEAFAKELPALPPASGSPAPYAPKLSECERIFATWESLPHAMKSLYFGLHGAVLRGPRPSSLDGLTDSDRASEVLYQLAAEGLMTVEPGPASAATPGAAPAAAAAAAPAVEVDATEAIFAQFDRLKGAERTAFYRKHEALLSHPFLRPSHARQRCAPVALATNAPTGTIDPNTAIFDKFAELSGPARTAFFREHRSVLRHANRAARSGSPAQSPGGSTWKDPAPELFARWESLTGAAKTEFFRQHKAVLSRPKDFYAMTA